MRSKWMFAAMFFLMACVSTFSTAIALDWYVKTDGSNANDGNDWENAKKTIQAAIDAASPGDVINVASGTYYEKLEFKDGITLLGEGAETTRIEYGGGSSVIYAVQVQSGEISGFTIAYIGFTDLPTVLLGDSSLTIIRNIITGAQYDGIEIAGNSAPRIIDNEITDNTRAGIYSHSGSHGVISGNAISGNGLHGIALLADAYPQIIHNTIANNDGAGIWVAGESSPSVLNNIIVRNAQYGIDTKGYSYSRGFPAVLFNDVWENGAADYSGIGKPATDISVDPIFVDPEFGDYHLEPDSPCLGAADDGSDLGMYSAQRVTTQSLLINITSTDVYWENGILTIKTITEGADSGIRDVLFQYSLDGRTWHDIGRDTRLPYTVDWNTTLITPADDSSVWVKATATNNDGMTGRDIIEFVHPPKAPMFHGRDLVDDEDISLADLEGYVLIINFWATWCGPCRVEIPDFVELQEKYRNKKFSVIGMSLDRDRNAEATVTRFIADYKINYPVMMAVGQIEDDYQEAWGQLIANIPTTFIVDRAGKIVKVFVGSRSKSVFEREILELLEVEVSITSLPVTTGTEGVPYSYDVQTSYEAVVSTTYSLTTSPDGMTIDPETGLITWTPSSIQAGAHPVTVEVTNEYGGSDTQSFTIDVAEAINNAPVITSTPRTVGMEDFLYQYQMEATDADSDPLTFSLITSPEGMTIDADTGLVQWTSTSAQNGDNDVTVQVSDGRDGVDTQSFTINIAKTNDPPVITSTPVTTGTENVLYSYDVDATDPDANDTLTYSLAASPSGMTIDPDTGLIQWTPGYDVAKTAEGSREVSVTVVVTDPYGLSDEEGITITIANVNRPPEVHGLGIGPGSPSTKSNLTASYVYTDPDDDKESGSEIRWYKDDELQESYNDQRTVLSADTAGMQKWHFAVKPKDGVDFGKLQTSDPTTIIDVTRPVITSGPSVSAITPTSVVITWVTDEVCSSVVEYGTHTGYGLTVEGADNVKEHSVSLDSLLRNTKYYYRVGSTDSSGNTVWSAQKTFEITGMKGDVNNDGQVNSIDATMALRIAAGLIIPTEYQEWAADMNGDGEVRSDDAISILLEIVGLAAPDIEYVSRAGGPITVTLAEARAIAGESVTVPLRVDGIGELTGGDIQIAYDSTVLQAVNVSSDTDILMANIAEPGTVRIAFADPGRLTSKTIAEIQFHVMADKSSPLELQEVELYGPDALPLSSRCVDKEFRSWAIPAERSALLQNFPNPFNPDTWIPYQLREGGEVTIQIFSIQGELVREFNLGYRDAGSYVSQDRAVHWDGRNENGEKVASGIYFYSLRGGEFLAVRKLTVLQ
ncbi:putative Ig domain-containing protein [Candidatus Poribacteria bacterium]